MSDMPKLEAGDMVRPVGDISGLFLEACDTMDAGTSRLKAEWRYAVCGSDSESVCVCLLDPKPEDSTMMLIPLCHLSASTTIHRNGEQIWPRQEPSIEECVGKTIHRIYSDESGMGVGLCRSLAKEAASNLSGRFDITRKEAT